MLSIFKKRKARKFGEIAVDKNPASQEDVRDALKTQQAYREKRNLHKKIGSILSERGVLTQDDIKIILEKQKKPTSLMAWFYAPFTMNK